MWPCFGLQLPQNTCDGLLGLFIFKRWSWIHHHGHASFTYPSFYVTSNTWHDILTTHVEHRDKIFLGKAFYDVSYYDDWQCDPSVLPQLYKLSRAIYWERSIGFNFQTFFSKVTSSNYNFLAICRPFTYLLLILRKELRVLIICTSITPSPLIRIIFKKVCRKPKYSSLLIYGCF